MLFQDMFEFTTLIINYNRIMRSVFQVKPWNITTQIIWDGIEVLQRDVQVLSHHCWQDLQ